MYYQKAVQEKVKKKFGSHKILKSKYVPKYPASAERELLRVINGYLRVTIIEVLKEFLPEIKAAIFEEKTRQDSLADVLITFFNIFAKMDEKSQQKAVGYELSDRLKKIASITRRFSKLEWQKAVNKTLGINLLDDYFEGEFYDALLKNWVDYNVDLIVTIPQKTLGKMRQIMLDGYKAGKPYTTLIKEVEHNYSVTRSHARLLARDQMGKLNGQIAQKQQQDAGCTEYIWTTTGDRRVREGHSLLEGKRFNWNDPPEVDKLGRRLHPGQDYQCRCIAIPVFDFENINLPMKEE